MGGERYEQWQLGMDGHDPDVYMEMALVKPGDNPNDVHARRSYAAQCITKQVNKVINLPVLKAHQSAGVTLCLKNLSHGMVNNVNRSHINRELNACNLFIPAVVDLPVIRQKVVLHIRRRQSGLQRRSRHLATIPLGTQNHVLRNRSCRARQDRLAGG